MVGTLWSCTPDGSGGSTLQVSASSAPIGSLQGYYGVSVRCVRAREGQAIPCFFPLAGSAGSGAAVSGFYWSATTDRSPGVANILALLPTGASTVDQKGQPNPYSVRCVRAREGQAIPLFWIVWFWVL